MAINVTTKGKAQLYTEGASIDAHYGPWISKEYYENWVTQEMGLQLREGVTIAVKEADGKIVKYVRENGAWREDGGSKQVVTKESIGLGNVDNTSDMEKPVSNATQEALNKKVSEESLTTMLENKVNIDDMNKALEGKADKAEIAEISEHAKKADASASQAQASAENAADSAKVVEDALKNLPSTPEGVTAQVALNTSYIDKLKGVRTINTDDFIKGVWVSHTDGTETANEFRASTPFVAVKKGEIIEAQGDTQNYAFAIFFDTSKQYTSYHALHAASSVEVAKDGYVRFMGYPNPAWSAYIKGKSILDFVRDDAGETDHSLLELISQDLGMEGDAYYRSAIFTNIGYLDKSQGNVVETGPYRNTGYIRVAAGDKVVAFLGRGSNTPNAICFYDDNNTFVQGVSMTYASTTNELYECVVPSAATKMRCCCVASLIEQAYIRIKGADNTLDKIHEQLNKIGSRVSASSKARVTNTLCNYKGFGVPSSRITITETTDSNARMNYKTIEQHINRTKLEMVFSPKTSNCKTGIGFNAPYLYMTEIRVYGNTFEIYSGGAMRDGTTQAASGAVVFSQTLGFSLAVGKMYKLSIEKRDAIANGSGGFIDDCVFAIDDFDGHAFEKHITRDKTAMNGVSTNIIGICDGEAYISHKLGSVDIINISLSSQYNPHAKVVYAGDSYVAGDTLVGLGQDKKCAALIQQAIGDKDVVLTGIGGELLNNNWYNTNMQVLEWFQPDYLIVALGINNASDFDSYKTILDKTIEYCDACGIIPILTTIPPRGNPDTASGFRTQANAYVRNSGRLYVDISKAVTTDSTESTWKTGVVQTYDYIHPTPTGHALMAERFKIEVPEIFVK